MRVAPQITLDDKERQILQRWSRGRSTPARLVLRARIVLLAAKGTQNNDIASELGTERTIVGRWRSRFAQHGLAGIEKDAPRSGRRPTKRDKLARLIIKKTTKEKAGERDPLEYADFGEGTRHQSVDGSSRVKAKRAQAASGANVQGQQRSPLRGETGRCGWPVSEPAGTCPGAVLRMRRARSRPWIAPSPACR